MTASSPSSPLAAAARRVEATLDDVFAAADDLRRAVESIWRHAEGRAVTPTDLHELQPLIGDTLRALPHLSGCGFVAELGVVDGTRRHWEWWVPSTEGARPRPLLLRTGADDTTSYAYESMAWFSGPRSGKPTVVGPYLDFDGADRFVITCAEPVTHEGSFIGVTGADVLLSLLEPIFLGHLSGLGHTGVLINKDARVVTSNSPEFVPGERFRAAELDRERVDVGRADWTLCRVD